MGAEGGRGGVDLLDAPVLEPAAVVEHLMPLELLDPDPDALRVAPRRQPPGAQRAEDPVGIRLEDGRLAERPLGYRALGVGDVRREHAELAELRRSSAELGIEWLGANAAMPQQ